MRTWFLKWRDLEAENTLKDAFLALIGACFHVTIAQAGEPGDRRSVLRKQGGREESPDSRLFGFTA